MISTQTGSAMFMTEGAAINLLRLVESSPDHARQRTIVAGEKCIGEIVSGPGFSRGRNFFRPNSVRAAWPVPDSTRRPDMNALHMRFPA